MTGEDPYDDQGDDRPEVMLAWVMAFGIFAAGMGFGYLLHKFLTQ